MAGKPKEFFVWWQASEQQGYKDFAMAASDKNVFLLLSSYCTSQITTHHWGNPYQTIFHQNGRNNVWTNEAGQQMKNYAAVQQHSES